MKITEKDFLRAMPQETNQRYFDMVNRRIARTRSEAAARKGRHLMKKIGKFAIGAVVTAAVLTAGGITAMVAMRGSLGGYNKYDGSSIKVIETHTEENKLQLNLTDAEWSDIRAGGSYTNETLWFTGSENGWYHEKLFGVVDDTGFDYSTAAEAELRERSAAEQQFYDATGVKNTDTYYAYAIWYYDSETGKDVPLCANPSCLHDGSEFCEATTHKYKHGNLLCYDGALYAAGIAVDAEQPKEQRLCLLSYDPNGTGITELAAFEKGYGEPLHILVHRGYVFCMFRVTLDGETHYGGPGIPSGVSYPGCGFVIWGYEIATGKATEMLRAVPKTVDSEEIAPNTFTASGDYLYFDGNGGWPHIYRQGTYGLSLLSGECKQVTANVSAEAAGKYLVSCDYNTLGNTLNVLDTETGESADYTCSAGRFTTDGTHIFFAEPKLSITPDASYVHVYDMQMNEVGGFGVDEKYALESICIIDGCLCALRIGSIDSAGRKDPSAESDTVLIRCKIDDILNGTASWEELCTVADRELFSKVLADYRNHNTNG